MPVHTMYTPPNQSKPLIAEVWFGENFRNSYTTPRPQRPESSGTAHRLADQWRAARRLKKMDNILEPDDRVRPSLAPAPPLILAEVKLATAISWTR